MTLPAGRALGERPPGPAAGTDWQGAFAALPRALFLPELIWVHDMTDGTSTPVERGRDPDRWQAAAAADVPVITQWDDGRHTGTAPGSLPTSSASMPSVVVAMLDALDVTAGTRVLEIGTGTGWNAGLLAHRLGGQHVTRVEVDPGVAEAARRALRAAGQSPRVVTGDGMRGVPDAAPFDRILATVGLRKIPSAWSAQVTPGGLIVAPWGTHYSNRDALVRLTVTGDGTAAGAFLRPLEFMKVRAQRLARPIMRTGPGAPVTDSTAPGPLPPEGTWHPFPFVAGLRIPRATHAVQRHEDGTTLWLYDLDGSAWASATHRTGDSAVRVRQVGRRRLWDELTAAHTWWTAHGAPGYQRLGLTVTPESTRAWLDTPDHSWPVG